MDINTLRQFRHDIYDCLPKAKDALFNTIDAFDERTSSYIVARDHSIGVV
jgi:hypothetical protein